MIYIAAGIALTALIFSVGFVCGALYAVRGRSEDYEGQYDEKWDSWDY